MSEAKDADVDRLTFAEWFKREYPLYEREGASRDTSLKAALRIAWETAKSQSLSQEAVRDEALELGLLEWLKNLGDSLDHAQTLIGNDDYQMREALRYAHRCFGKSLSVASTLAVKARALKREPSAAIPIKAPLQCPACLDAQPYAACCCMKSATARSLR